MRAKLRLSVMLQFGRRRDDQKAETQSRRSEARSADEPSSRWSAQRPAEENARAARARGAGGGSEGLGLILSPSAALPRAIAAFGLFVALTLALALRLSAFFDALDWSLFVVAVVGLAAAIQGFAQNAGAFSKSGVFSKSREVVLALPAPELDRDGAAEVLEASPLPMLLIDATYRIVASYSHEFEALFHASSLRDEDFLRVLRRLVSEPKVNSTRDFLADLFDFKGGADVAARNPLKRVEAMVDGPAGGSVLRVLSFGFKRIERGDSIERAVIWVDDLTDRLAAERSRGAAEALKARQFEVLAEVIHIERERLDAFVARMLKNLSAIDDLLRAGDKPSPDETQAFRKRIEDVLTRVDAITAEAERVNFRRFRRRSAAYRAKVVELAERDSFGGDDFLTLVMEQSAFRAEVDDLLKIRELLDRPPADDSADRTLDAVSPASETEGPLHDAVVDEVEDLARRLAAASGKEVIVDAEGFDTRSLGERRRNIVRDVLAELTRNALEHGIESPEVRQLVGKPRAGLIRIRQTSGSVPDVFTFAFRDDGGGLDAPSLRERALEHGLLEPASAATLEDSQVAALIFAPELTTGMDAVKRKIVDECGGSISVDSEDGVFCEFSFVVPEGFK